MRKSNTLPEKIENAGQFSNLYHSVLSRYAAQYLVTLS